MSFTVGSIGAALWIVGGQIELKTPPSAVLFLCPSHVISKPTETELDNNLNTEERAQQVRNFTHYTTTLNYCTN